MRRVFDSFTINANLRKTITFLACVLFSIVFGSSTLLAGPANPNPELVTQPNGTEFLGVMRGDEFQGWMETVDGYTIVRNESTGYFEYAGQSADGNLFPNGVRVASDNEAQLKSLGLMPQKGIRPPRNYELEKYQTDFLNASRVARLISPDFQSLTGVWTPTPVSGPKKILMVLVNFSNATLSSGSAAYWSNLVHGSSGQSVAKYYQDNSFGTVSIAPVEHTQPSSPTGVVTVTLPRAHPNCAGACSYATESSWINSALSAASAYVNFPALDTNGNGTISVDETLVYFVLAGYETAAGSGLTPSIWAHAWGGGGVSVNGKNIDHWALNGEMYDASNRMTMGVVTHEMGHAMGGLPDLYDTSGNNAGLGIFSLMAGGSWGNRSGEIGGATPVGLDAWSRQYLGWSNPQTPVNGSTVSFPSPLTSPTATVMLLNPTISSSEYWLVENRPPLSWDEGIYGGFWSSWTGGLLVQHIDLNIGSKSLNNFNRYVSSTSHQGNMAVEPSSATCSLKSVGNYSWGCPSILYSAGNTATFNSSSNPNSNYYSGAASGLGISAISSPSSTMTGIIQSPNLATSPTAPTGVSATPGNSSASVSFTPGSLGSGSLVTYVASCTDGTTTQTASGSQTSLTVSGLVNGRAYTCRALTRSSVGDSPLSTASNVVIPGTATAPNSVTGTATKPFIAVINFSLPSYAGSSPLTGYTATCTASGQTTQTATGTSSPITIKNLKPGVTYSCKVVANNSYGSGLESATVQIKVRGVDLSAILSLLLLDDATSSFTISGIVSGLSANTQVTLNNNSGNPTTVTNNGGFTFSTPVSYNGSYSVTVATQPAGQICTVTNGNGSGVTANVSNISVACHVTLYTVSTLAGTGSVGSADGAGTNASFNFPTDVAVDASGNLYVADNNNFKIRKITAAGVVSTLASSSFNFPWGVAVDSSGSVYVGDIYNNQIRKITPVGVVSTYAGTGAIGSSDGAVASSTFRYPRGVALDSSGNVYVCDYGNNKIRKITAAGVVSTLAGTGGVGSADGAGSSATFNNPQDITVDASGNVYVADTDNHKIRKITASGIVSTFAGTGNSGSTDGAGSSASFNGPTGIAVDSSGMVFVGDSSQKIRKITPAGVVTTIAGTGSYGSADGPGSTASFYFPSGLAVDNNGNVYVADHNNHRIRKLTPQ